MEIRRVVDKKNINRIVLNKISKFGKKYKILKLKYFMDEKVFYSKINFLITFIFIELNFKISYIELIISLHWFDKYLFVGLFQLTIFT